MNPAGPMTAGQRPAATKTQRGSANAVVNPPGSPTAGRRPVGTGPAPRRWRRSTVGNPMGANVAAARRAAVVNPAGAMTAGQRPAATKTRRGSANALVNPPESPTAGRRPVGTGPAPRRWRRPTVGDPMARDVAAARRAAVVNPAGAMTAGRRPAATKARRGSANALVNPSGSPTAGRRPAATKAAPRRWRRGGTFGAAPAAKAERIAIASLYGGASSAYRARALRCT